MIILIKAIHISKRPAWYCRECCETSLNLYKDEEGNKWFDCCVPEDIKKQAKYFNQIGEEIEVGE